ncbi:hypothetical protein R50071_29400 [Halioxenophilus aromaticivorans]
MTVVKALYVIKDTSIRFLLRGDVFSIKRIDLESCKEGFHGSIISAITFATYTRVYAFIEQ